MYIRIISHDTLAAYDVWLHACVRAFVCMFMHACVHFHAGVQ